MCFFRPFSFIAIFMTIFGHHFLFASIINNRIEKYIDSKGECNLPQSLRNEIAGHQSAVTDILNQIVDGKYAGDTHKSLEIFCDTFGPRMSGSPGLEAAIDYMVDQLNGAGLENVHTENASVPHWERGYESAQLTQPHKQNLPMLGLGSSVGTPRGGIMGEAIAVESFKEFASISDDDVRGKIVVFAPKWEGYAKTVPYRRDGATVAAKRGAIAVLIRSITPFSIGSPHTGWQAYDDGTVTKIPAACITVEDAEMLLRIYRRGDAISIRLEMEDRNFPATISRNTIGELQGSGTNVNESIVILSGHLDSWDVGVGAMDDGGGAFISWKALEYLKKMNYRAKRTLRSILWTGEEQGLWGSRAYAESHKEHERREFNFFFESDIGTFEPRGLDYTGTDDGACIIKEILKLMVSVNATEFAAPADGGPDISVWLDRGFPGASLLNRNEQYFWYHHSAGDSMLLENSNNLDKATALFAAASYVVANLNDDIPRDLK